MEGLSLFFLLYRGFNTNQPFIILIYIDDSAQGAVVTTAGVVSVAKTNKLMGKTLTPGTELYVDLPDPNAILSRMHTFTGRVENRFPFDIVTERPDSDYYTELVRAFCINHTELPEHVNTAVGNIAMGMHTVEKLPGDVENNPKKFLESLTIYGPETNYQAKSALGRMISGFSTLVDDSNRFRLGTVIEDRGTHLSIVLCPRTSA